MVGLMEDSERSPLLSEQRGGNNGFNPSNQLHGFVSYGEGPLFAFHVLCGHCSQTFPVMRSNRAESRRGLPLVSHWTLARCPHCEKVSSTSQTYSRRMSLLGFLVFGLFVAFAAGLMALTWSDAQTFKPIYVSWAVAIAMSLGVLARALYWWHLKISPPVSSRV